MQRLNSTQRHSLGQFCRHHIGDRNVTERAEGWWCKLCQTFAVRKTKVERRTQKLRSQR